MSRYLVTLILNFLTSGASCSKNGQCYPPDKSLSNRLGINKFYCVVQWIVLPPFEHLGPALVSMVKTEWPRGPLTYSPHKVLIKRNPYIIIIIIVILNNLVLQNLLTLSTCTSSCFLMI